MSLELALWGPLTASRSICKRLKAVYLWVSAFVSGGAGESLMAAKLEGERLKARRVEVLFCTLGEPSMSGGLFTSRQQIIF